MGRANYELPDDALSQVRQLSGAKSKKEAIVIALHDYIRKKKLEKLIAAQGKIALRWTRASLRKYRG